ncbi:MAG: hypothetical protein HW380_606 [Magnetococcales bacterium]|nr:hypothetical protein [Magnetococcales bacterium]HIJ83270.1 hypothetical protein [Magnetococcales bacterium]
MIPGSLDRMVIQKQDELQKIWKKLGGNNRDTLLKFAQFLLEREEADHPPIPVEPLGIPAPPGENVVQALKRLKKNYPMIETDIQLLDDASQFIMQKVLGAPDTLLIEKMEKLFLDNYQRWRERDRSDVVV